MIDLLIFAPNTQAVVLVRTTLMSAHNYIFSQKKKKKNCKPHFYLYKMGFPVCSLHQLVNLMKLKMTWTAWVN